MGQPRGRRVRLFVKADDNVSKQREHQNRYGNRDRQENCVVEPFDVGLNWRIRRQEANLSGLRCANDRRLRRAEQKTGSKPG